MAKELTEGLARLGHEVRVVTTSLRAVGEPPAARWQSRTRDVGGVTVEYLATPVRYRWMGVTPTLPLSLVRGRPPDIVHVFGYRDVVTTAAAAWARVRRTPYVFEPLNMFVPRFRNVPLKRTFDAVVGRPVARGATLVVANSRHERAQLVGAGLDPDRVVTRPNGFPPPRDPAAPTGALRHRLGLGADVPLVLNVGRLSFKKGLDLLLKAVAPLPGAHVALLGPDDGDGTLGRLQALRDELGLGGRVHFLGPSDERGPGDAYADADVFVLPSREESFGMVAAEAAASGTAVVVTDRCGVAEVLEDRAAVVVPCAVEPIRDAVRTLLGDPALRRRLGEAGRAVAREVSWEAVVRRQEEIYRLALRRT
jgi:glycosyltransferase involved in cell wall biosynthesis